MRWLDSVTDLMDVILSKLRELVVDREDWHLVSWVCLQFQFTSVAQSCPTLCDPMNCSAPDLPVHHQLLEYTQTHVH